MISGNQGTRQQSIRQYFKNCEQIQTRHDPDDEEVSSAIVHSTTTATDIFLESVTRISSGTPLRQTSIAQISKTIPPRKSRRLYSTNVNARKKPPNSNMNNTTKKFRTPVHRKVQPHRKTQSRTVPSEKSTVPKTTSPNHRKVLLQRRITQFADYTSLRPSLT
jgi:hypothetical protein